jgi:hypothetical protein
LRTTTVPRVLTEPEAVALGVVCDRMIPGSARAGAVDYIDRIARALPAADLRSLRAAIAILARVADDDAAFGAEVGTVAFGTLRGLVIAAYYGDYTPDGYSGPTGWQAIGFDPPQAVRLRKDWSFLDERAPR